MDFCNALSQHNFDVVCPNLLEREIAFDYTQEDLAYGNFMNNVGFTDASQKVRHLLADIKDQYKKVFIVGFSVGATIASLCSEDAGLGGVVGYYGSRIRNYVEITPQCPTLLFFPHTEKSFNVDELISSLNKDQIEIHKFSGQHGFSDPYTPQFDEQSAQNTFGEMLNYFKENY